MTKKMNIPFSPPDITKAEADEVYEALLSGWITTGPRVKEFERQIAQMCHLDINAATNQPNVVCLSSATSSMAMAYNLIGIKPGDEVIVPAYTYTATASCVVHNGGKLVFVDSKPGSFEMDYEKLAKAITPRTKVITAVDIAGIICDYDKIYDIVNRPEIKSMFKAESEIQDMYGRIIVMADCAHSFGSKQVMADGTVKMAGDIADFSAFSFHAVKNFTTAEGGALTWHSLGDDMNARIYKKLQLLSLHGQSKDALAKTKLGGWEYDIVGAYYKANMTDIMAAIGLVQMKRYPAMLERRRQIFSYYDDRLKKYADNGTLNILNHFEGNKHSNCHLYQIRLNGKGEEYRNDVITKMAEMGVATNVHFKPLPLMTAYKEMGFDIKDFHNAYEFYKNSITLPTFSKMTDEQTEYVMDCLVNILES